MFVSYLNDGYCEVVFYADFRYQSVCGNVTEHTFNEPGFLITESYEATESGYSSSQGKHINQGTGCLINWKVDCKKKTL